MRPTRLSESTEPIPTTTVQKITGVMTILMRLTNDVPNGCRPDPTSGASAPTAMPAAMPASTQT